MEFKPSLNNEVDSWKEVILIYNSALKEIGTKLEILNDEFQHVHRYNPIEHIKSRLKTPESIVKKLKRQGYESTIDNMVQYVNDIAGVRVICSFTSDIYRIAEMIAGQSDIKLISVKDYIQNPKKSGYRSFHMIVSVPIFLSDRAADTKVEIQIRTVAMDFWASLEHKINYKFEGNVPDFIKRELIECSRITYELDERMLILNDQVNKYDTSNQGSVDGPADEKDEDQTKAENPVNKENTAKSENPENPEKAEKPEKEAGHHGKKELKEEVKPAHSGRFEKVKKALNRRQSS